MTSTPMRTLYVVCISSLMVIIAAAHPPVQAQDRTVNVSSQDRDMNAAIAKAQSTLDTFLRTVAAPPPDAHGFALKVRFKTAAGGEHMWVIPFRQTATGFLGTLANKPVEVTTLRAGQEVTFQRGDITDWAYTQGSKQKGNFTVCAMLKHIPAAEAAQARSEGGFEC